LAKFSSATTEVTANSFQDVLAVLAGPSGWLQYLGNNVETVRQSISSFSFVVEPEKEFADHLQRLGLGKLPEDAVGVTDKQTGTILLLKKTTDGFKVTSAPDVSPPTCSTRCMNASIWSLTLY
jgi:hypothetical protein